MVEGFSSNLVLLRIRRFRQILSSAIALVELSNLTLSNDDRAVSMSWLVSEAVGVHPVPSRTRSLSPPAPRVLGGTPPGRLGRRQLPLAHSPLVVPSPPPRAPQDRRVLRFL